MPDKPEASSSATRQPPEAVKPPEGKVTTEGAGKVEITAATLRALEKVAETIGCAVAARVPAGPVVIVDPATLKALRSYATTSAQIERLMDALPSRQASAGLESLDVVAGVQAATGAVAALAALAAYFRTDTKLTGSDVVVPERVLRAAVAGGVLAAGRSAVLPGLAVGGATTRPSIVERLDALLVREAAAVKAAAGTPREAELAPVSAAVKELSKLLLAPPKAGEPDTLAELLAVEGVLPHLDDGALLLLVETVAAGGSVRTRSGLWANLFGRADIAWSGGIAVAYTLVDPATQLVRAGGVASRVLPHAPLVELDGANAGNFMRPVDLAPEPRSAAAPHAAAALRGLEGPAGAEAAALPHPRYGVVFASLVPGGFFSDDPDDLAVKRAIRTNNPGALNVSGWQRRFPGFVAETRPDAAGNVTSIYRTPEHGTAAWFNLLANRYGFGADGQVRVGDLAMRYAGVTAEDHPAVRSYLAGWGRFSGGALAADTVVSLASERDTLTLARAMFAHEIGRASPLSDEQIAFAVRVFRAGTLPP